MPRLARGSYPSGARASAVSSGALRVASGLRVGRYATGRQPTAPRAGAEWPRPRSSRASHNRARAVAPRALHHSVACCARTPFDQMRHGPPQGSVLVGLHRVGCRAWGAPGACHSPCTSGRPVTVRDGSTATSHCPLHVELSRLREVAPAGNARLAPLHSRSRRSIPRRTTSPAPGLGIEVPRETSRVAELSACPYRAVAVRRRTAHSEAAYPSPRPGWNHPSCSTSRRQASPFSPTRVEACVVLDVEASGIGHHPSPGPEGTSEREELLAPIALGWPVFVVTFPARHIRWPTCFDGRRPRDSSQRTGIPLRGGVRTGPHALRCAALGTDERTSTRFHVKPGSQVRVSNAADSPTAHMPVTSDPCTQLMPGRPRHSPRCRPHHPILAITPERVAISHGAPGGHHQVRPADPPPGSPLSAPPRGPRRGGRARHLSASRARAGAPCRLRVP